MKRGSIFTVLFLFVLIIPMISAEIVINSQPKSVYNIGDTLNISVTVKAVANGNGFIDLYLDCNNSNVNFYRSPLSLTAGGQKIITNSLTLSKDLIENAIGDCRITAAWSTDTMASSGFTISDRINVNLDKLVVSADPGESIIVTGTAIKESSENVEGFATIYVLDTSIRANSIIKNGKIDANISFPKEMASGAYRLVIDAYDSGVENSSNRGSSSIDVTISQIPTKMNLTVDKPVLIPGESLIILPSVLDQANDNVQADVKLEMYNPSGEIYLDKLVKTDQEIPFYFDTNSSPGSWKIVSSAFGLESSVTFSVGELQKASFKVENDTLLITNMGNVPYTKPVQVVIGNTSQVIQLNLAVGESKMFQLTAPDGDYPISVTDGQESLDLTGVSLTGNAIGIMDIEKQINLFARYPLVWIFLIVVIGMFVIMTTKRFSKKEISGYVFGTKNTPVVRDSGFTKVQSKEKVVPGLAKFPKNAEHALILEGNKENASIVALRIKNYDQLKNEKGNALETIEKAIESVNNHKGTLYRKDDTLVGIMTPSLTKTFGNEVIAIRVANEILTHLNEHNGKFTQKIDFGIGVHSGEMVMKNENGVLKFTPIGNSLNIAKKISDSASNNVLLSEAVNRKVINDVKTEKQGDYYGIRRMVEREQHKKFINNFLDRQKK